MKVRILPSATDGSDQQFLTTLVLNDVLAVDAGCLGFYATPAEQARIANVVLTHSHADHVCSLPTFAMNVADFCGRPTIVWAHEAVLEALRTDMFNGRTWPDFLTLKTAGEPIVQVRPVRPRRPFELHGLRLTAIPVNHPVPTMGYIVEDAASAIVICTDSGPTDEIWDRARALENLATVFVGVAFPDGWEALATVAGHLTPTLLHERLVTLPRHIRVVAVHIKPACSEEVVAQLAALAVPALSVGTTRTAYECWPPPITRGSATRRPECWRSRPRIRP